MFYVFAYDENTSLENAALFIKSLKFITLKSSYFGLWSIANTYGFFKLVMYSIGKKCKFSQFNDQINVNLVSLMTKLMFFVSQYRSRYGRYLGKYSGL